MGRKLESDSPSQHKYQTRSKTNKSKRKIYKNESSDDNSEYLFENTELDNDSSNSDPNKDPEAKDFHQLLLQLFPSQYLKNKTQNNKKFKKSFKEPEENIILFN